MLLTKKSNRLKIINATHSIDSLQTGYATVSKYQRINDKIIFYNIFPLKSLNLH